MEREKISSEFKWDLSNIYKDQSELNSDMVKLEGFIADINSYKGKLNSSLQIANMFKIYENISRIGQRIYVYTHMKLHEDTRDNKSQELSGKSEMISTKVSSETSFIVPQLIQIEDAKMNEYLNSKELKPYKKYIEEILRSKPYTLSEHEEEILAKSLDISNVPENTYDMLSFADLKFPEIENEKNEKVQLTHSNFSKFMQCKNKDVRKNAFEKLYETYGKYKNTFASTLYGSLKKEVFYSSIRKYKSSLEASLFSDNINTKVYDNLIKVVSDNLDYMHRYLNLKKEYLGLDELHMYDLYVPLSKNFNYNIKYEKAKEIILKALEPLGQEYVSLLKKAFDEKWIDVYENEGKKGGAYSWGCYDSHPFILLNYKDDLNSLFTLAHELGHSIHSYYSRKEQPYLYSNYKIFVAEVASTVNEQLLMEYMLKNAQSDDEKLYLLNYYIEQFRTTVFRQTMFAEFEKIIHEKVESGENFTSDKFSNIYYDLNKKYYGNDMVVDEEIALEWARVPHFYSDFYVYKYATGFSAASAIKQNIVEQKEMAVDKYIEFLKSGGSDYPLNQLRNAGVDMEDKNSVQIALNVFKKLVDELEKQK